YWFKGKEFERRRGVIERLRSLAQREGRSLIGLALGWLRSRPGVSVILVGARNSAQVGEIFDPDPGALAQDTATHIDAIVADGIDHLAMADPPAPHDPHWPAIKQRYTLLLHDYLGQLSEPLDERSIARARSLAELYHTPWVAEHFQCLHTEDGRYNINYVFPP